MSALPELMVFLKTTDSDAHTRAAQALGAPALDIEFGGAVASDGPATVAAEALQLAVAEFDALLRRLLVRVRVQQNLDLFASVLALLSSSTLVATLEALKDEPRWQLGIGLVTVGAAILALLAKRMGGGEGGLVAKYGEYAGKGYEARSAIEHLSSLKGRGVDDPAMVAELEKARGLIRALADARHWMEATDFLFRGDSWVARRFGG